MKEFLSVYQSEPFIARNNSTKKKTICPIILAQHRFRFYDIFVVNCESYWTHALLRFAQTHTFFSFFRSVRRLGFVTFSTRHSFLKLNCGNDCEFGSNNFNSNRTVFSSLGRASVAEFFELPEEIVSNVTRFGSDIVIWFAP